MILLCVGGILFCSWLFLQAKGDGKKHLVISACVMLFLYAALRAHNLQPDIPVYVDYYNTYSKFSLERILSFFNSEQKDPFYYVFSWFFSRVFPDVQWWLAFVALVYLISVGILIYKESEAPLLSFLAFLTLEYFEFSLSGLRQALALSFTMLSFFSIKKKKWIVFVLLVLLASLFHRSALIFLIVYPIAHSRVGKLHLVVAIIVGIMFLVGEDYIRDFMRKYLTDGQYEGYVDRTVGLSFSGFIIQGAIFIFCFLYYPAVSRKYESANVLYNMVFIGLLFRLFSSMIAEVFRISMYFSIFNIILITMAISVEKDKKTRAIEAFGVGFLFIAYMLLTGIPEYAFFWS